MKYIVFDFNGTIVNDLNPTFELVKSELSKRKIAISNDLEDLRQNGVANFIKENHISKLEMVKIYLSLKKEIKKFQNDCPVVEGFEEVLPLLSSKAELSVYSSNSAKVIENYLEKYKIKKYFNEINEDNSYFGKHVGLNKFMKINKLKPEWVYYVGDESRDIIAANRSGVHAIAVSWGFEGEAALSLARPEYLISHPRELLKLF